jgi:hypothetical protein
MTGNESKTVRSTRLITITTAAVTIVSALSVAPPPAGAGRLCGRLDLSGPCASSSDLKPNLVVGGDAGQGRLRVRADDGTIAVDLRADNGSVTNLFANDPSASNGLVKAWARINADGTIAACWRCNRDPDETQQLAPGSYEVDFTPLDTDITERPRMATVSGSNGAMPQATIRAVDRTTPPDDSTVHIFTENPATGDRVDAPFVLVIY